MEEAEFSEEAVSDWIRVVDAYTDLCNAQYAFFKAKQTLFSGKTPYARVLSHAIRKGFKQTPVAERSPAIALMREMSAEDLKPLLPELVMLASWQHGSVGFIHELILALPREWVLERIETLAEPYFANDDYEEYACLLGLYYALNPDMAHRLAERAVSSANEDIKEIGEMFLTAKG